MVIYRHDTMVEFWKMKVSIPMENVLTSLLGSVNVRDSWAFRVGNSELVCFSL